MSEFNFKKGDWVYCPMTTNKVMQVSSRLNIQYQGIDGTNNTIGVYRGGKWSKQHHNPVIFPATQEWYEKLVPIYPDLEPPPKRKDPKQVIQAMLDDGWKNVPVIYWERGNECIGYANQVYLTMTATPFDPKTGKTIIDYVNGEVILESEDGIS